MDNNKIANIENAVAATPTTEIILNLIEDKNIDEALKKLDNMAASKAYVLIRDNIAPKHIKTIKESSTENYQLFQDIKARAKQSWDYDHKMATIEEVNRACANVYTLLLRIVAQYNDSFTTELTKIINAINKIEEKVGVDITDWSNSDDDSINGGNDNVNDVQGVKEDI